MINRAKLVREHINESFADSDEEIRKYVEEELRKLKPLDEPAYQAIAGFWDDATNDGETDFPEDEYWEYLSDHYKGYGMPSPDKEIEHAQDLLSEHLLRWSVGSDLPHFTGGTEVMDLDDVIIENFYTKREIDMAIQIIKTHLKNDIEFGLEWNKNKDKYLRNIIPKMSWDEYIKTDKYQNGM